MKKIGTLNTHLSRVIATMGHTDQLVVADCGLPIPRDAELIDLALTCNVPRFIETVHVILDELQVEEIIIAEEMESNSNGMYEALLSTVGDLPVRKVPHEAFKELTRASSTKGIVRTGESTPFANVVLVSGVTF